VEEYPARVELRKRCGLLAGAEGGNEAEKEADGKDKDAERDSFVAPVNKDEGGGEDQTEEGLGLVGVDGQGVMGGVEHLDEGDEVEE